MHIKSVGSALKHIFNWTLYKETYKEWSADKSGRLAAALAYHCATAMAPLIIGVLAMVGLFYDTRQAQAQLVAQVNRYVGAQGAQVVNTILANAHQPQLAKWAGVISLILLIWSASNIFVQLQDSLDTVWGVELRSDLPIMRKILHRLYPLLVVLGIGLLLVIAVIGSAALSAIGTFVSGLLPGGAFLWQVVNFVISIIVITLLFALIFKELPDVEIAWSDVWPGAALTAILFVIGQFVLGWYLGRESSTSVYGAAGSLIVLLLWLNYSAQIFLFGAEFTQVFATHYGKGVLPAHDAVAREFGAPEKAAAKAAKSGAEQPQFANAVYKDKQTVEQGRQPAPGSDDLSTGRLMLALVDDGRTLIQREMELASAELKEIVAQVARGVAFIVGGGMMLYAALLILLVAVALLLSGMQSPWITLLLIGILVLVEGWIITMSARHRLAKVQLLPRQTIETLNEDINTVQSHLAS